MTFVTVSKNYEQLAFLSHLLISLIPGCTIHRCCDPMRAIQHISSRKVDATFADADTIGDVMNLLSRQQQNTQIWILCRQDAALPKNKVGYNVLSYPITEYKIRNALQMDIPWQKKQRDNIR